MDLSLLVKDVYFWIGLVLFICSAIGVFVILKSLNKNTQSDIFVTGRGSSSFTGLATATSLAGTQVKESNPNYEILARELSRVVDTLVRIEGKIEKSKGLELGKLTEELKQLTLFLSETSTKIDSGQLNTMSTKIDKVYQVLTSVAETSEKKGP